ncbi:MAG: hypothetical protein BGN95_12585 [Sphingomonas sp. 66-10]|nr:MAG: hypothetical protein BGN95_12585 [Sphingomonas sp. 66-10]
MARRAAMPDQPSKPSAAGGFLIAAGVLGGAILGFAAGQPTIGVLIGLTVTVAISVAMWWRERG